MENDIVQVKTVFLRGDERCRVVYTGEIAAVMITLQYIIIVEHVFKTSPRLSAPEPLETARHPRVTPQLLRFRSPHPATVSSSLGRRH